MNQVEVITQLKKLADSNPTAKALFKVWSERTRARTTVTVGAVTQMMRLEGHLATRGHYADILRELAQLKLGTPIYTLRGNVAAITNVGATLQSIGAAGIGTADHLTVRQYSRRVAHIMTPTVGPRADTPPPRPPKPPVKPVGASTPIDKIWRGSKVDGNMVVGFRLKDKLYTVEIPNGCTTEEVAELIERLNPNKKEKEA